METKQGTETRKKTAQQEIDPVAESSDESFPASDSPAWTTSGDGRSELKKKKNPKSGSLSGEPGTTEEKPHPHPHKTRLGSG